MTSTAAPGKPDLRRIPLEAIQPHPANRKRFDRTQLAELAESLRTHGQLTPALVRPSGEGYQLLAGERRQRAAAQAGLDTLLCLVREVTDDAALEILAVENNQREDVHPLEEADLYKALLTVEGYDVARIASRLHRSVAYVYDRLKLLRLGREARQLFLDGRITVGHAVLLARLATADQVRAIGTEKAQYSDGGLLARDFTLFAPGEAEADAFQYKAQSIGELQSWIDRHVRFEAEEVAQADLLQLFPETAEALTRAKAAALTVIPITYEYAVREEARAEDGARTWGPMSWRRADGLKGSKPCSSTTLGTIVAGPGRGQAFVVCTNRKTCRVHWGPEIRAAAQRAKDRVVEAAAPGKGGTARKEKLQETWQEREQREKAQRAAWAAQRRAVLEAIEAKGLPPLIDLLPRILAQLLEQTDVGADELLADRLSVTLPRFGLGNRLATLAKQSATTIDQAFFYALIADDLTPYHANPKTDHLFALARSRGVDPIATMRAHEAAVKAAAKATAAPKANGKANPKAAVRPVRAAAGRAS